MRGGRDNEIINRVGKTNKNEKGWGGSVEDEEWFVIKKIRKNIEMTKGIIEKIIIKEYWIKKDWLVIRFKPLIKEASIPHTPILKGPNLLWTQLISDSSNKIKNKIINNNQIMIKGGILDFENPIDRPLELWNRRWDG